MAFTCIGLAFLFVLGAPIVYEEIFATDSTEPQGFRVFHNETHIIPLVCSFFHFYQDI